MKRKSPVVENQGVKMFKCSSNLDSGTNFCLKYTTVESYKLDLMWTEWVASYRNGEFYGYGDGLFTSHAILLHKLVINFNTSETLKNN